MTETPDTAGTFGNRPLLVVALGGNALSPPETVGEDYAPERRIVRNTGVELRRLATLGYRLLIVHGNGPQVGRLLRQDPTHGNLDIHVAQTQGELGYLLAETLDDRAVCVLTRVVVAADQGTPEKPIGPVLRSAPPGDAVRTGDGWRQVVSSPRPRAVLERAAIGRLLEHQHVIAGGGGGIPRDTLGNPVSGVVDKDRVAALLAMELAARALVFATNVDGVYPEPETRSGAALSELSIEAARALVTDGRAAPGSMGPKLESAADFAAATGRTAYICALEQMASALAGENGTRVRQR